MLTAFTCLLAVFAAGRVAASGAGSSVLGPSGEVLIAPSANSLQQVEAPQLAPAPGASSRQVQADCLIEQNAFYGIDFLSTRQVSAASPNDCCAACKLASDCTVWNWCGNAGGCPLPANLALAGNRTTVDFQACIWKPRPLTYSGTLPDPPLANRTPTFSGWTSGIPINGTLLPALPGFEMTPGIEMAYSEDTDFFCAGSSTSKPVCQLYGSAKGGALACLNNPICRGFQICWAFPAGSDGYRQPGIIRMKAGAQAPLNVSGSFQNPYCSVYVLKAGAASSPNSGTGGYSIRDASNITAVSAAVNNLGARKLLQTTGSLGSGRGQSQPEVINLAPSVAPAPTSLAAAQSPIAAASRGGRSFPTPLLGGMTLQAFPNMTFNYTGCYANAPSIRVTIQSQPFPLGGPIPAYSIHTWTEVPFHNNGDACCAFKDEEDYFLNLQTGLLAKTLPMFVATDARLITGAALKNYDTTPVSIASPLVYIPPGQLNNPTAGSGRQFTFPQLNSTDYRNALEQMYFSISQVALGNRFCTTGSPQLVAAVNFVGELLGELLDGEEEAPGGTPAGLEYVPSGGTLPDGSSLNASCLVERNVIYEGDVLETILSGNGTVEACCEACWLYFEVGGRNAGSSCDLWTLEVDSGVCQLKNSTLAEDFQPVPTQRDTAAIGFTSGRRTAILPTTTMTRFVGEIL